MAFCDGDDQDKVEEQQREDTNDNIDDFIMVDPKIEILNEIAVNEGPDLPEIGSEDLQFTVLVENLLKKSRGEIVAPKSNDQTKNSNVERILFRDNNKYKTEAMYRQELHRVSTESMAAKGLFRFAVLCVIKNNRMKRGEMMKDQGRNLQHQDQFQMNQEQKNAHFNALKHLLEKALSFSGNQEEPKDKKAESQSDSQRKQAESSTKKEKEVIKNL